MTVIVPLYNEEAVVSAKIRNLENADYPDDRLTVFFGSDGSTDATNEILAAEGRKRGIRYCIFSERRGKAALLNDLVGDADSDVIVFSDANATFAPDTISRLVAPFRDSCVGGVVGELILRSDETLGGHGEGLYWRYENFLKQRESDIATTIGAVGPVYAIRRKLYAPLPTDTAIMDDFVIPMEIIRRGYRVVYEPRALAYERPAESVRREFRRKARIGAANIQGLSRFAAVLSPVYGFAAFALWSHKVLRWLVPVLLIVMFVSSLLLARESPGFRMLVFVQMAFAGLALIGLVLETLHVRLGALGLPYYFVATNAALLLGLVRGLRGRQAPTWDIVR